MSRRRIALVATAGAVALYTALRQRHNLGSFAGKSVLITGGSRGLGLAIARLLADEGALLTVMARDTDEVLRAARELSGRGARVLALRGDVRDEAVAQRAVAQVLEEFGRLDVLVNNAGIDLVGPLEHLSTADFADALATNLWGPLHMALAAIPPMHDQGGGRIVNISSIGGLVALPHQLPYSVSKFALVGLSQGLRAELAQHNILVTTVCPGTVRSGAHLNVPFKGRHEEEYRWFALADLLPGIAEEAETTARQILAACRRGDAMLVTTGLARVMATAHALAPGATAELLALMNRTLPPPSDAPDAQERRIGAELTDALPGAIEALGADAAERYNNLRAREAGA